MNIYVSNINYRTTNESFEELFAQFGEITSARIINDRETGRSRGFGFVEMPNDEEAEKAIEEVNGMEFEGKVLNVSVARERERRDNRQGGFGGGRGGYRRGGDRGGYRGGDRRDDNRRGGNFDGGNNYGGRY